VFCLFVYLSVCLCFPSVSNFYFTSQYNQFPLSHTAAAATAVIHTYPRAAAAAAATTTPTISLKFHPKHEKCKQKR
jgi:hypothetical protein